MERGLGWGGRARKERGLGGAVRSEEPGYSAAQSGEAAHGSHRS